MNEVPPPFADTEAGRKFWLATEQTRGQEVVRTVAAPKAVERHKPFVSGTWRVIVELSADAQPVLDVMLAQWHPDRGQSFVVTHATVDGGTLKLQCDYAACGANGTDVRRRVERAVLKTGLREVGEMKVWKV